MSYSITKLLATVAHIKRGWTWSAKHGEWRPHKTLSAEVTKAPKGWARFFGAPKEPRGLSVVSIVYDWKLCIDGDYERKGGDF